MWKEVVATISCALAFMAVFVAITVYLLSLGASATCSAISSKMGVEHSYSLMTDCIVKVDGRWEPLRQHRSVRNTD